MSLLFLEEQRASRVLFTFSLLFSTSFIYSSDIRRFRRIETLIVDTGLYNIETLIVDTGLQTIETLKDFSVNSEVYTKQLKQTSQYFLPQMPPSAMPTLVNISSASNSKKNFTTPATEDLLYSDFNFLVFFYVLIICIVSNLITGTMRSFRKMNNL